MVGKNRINELIEKLKSRDPDVRNSSALELREIGDNSAVEPLLVEIFNPDNTNNRSTLVYALESLDCSRYFWEIFQLALSTKADVQMSALAILFEQEFWIFQEEELIRAKEFLSEHRDTIEIELYDDLLNLINDFYD